LNTMKSDISPLTKGGLRGVVTVWVSDNGVYTVALARERKYSNPRKISLGREVRAKALSNSRPPPTARSYAQTYLA
jgi:hypothetical protein